MYHVCQRSGYDLHIHVHVRKKLTVTLKIVGSNGERTKLRLVVIIHPHIILNTSLTLGQTLLEGLLLLSLRQQFGNNLTNKFDNADNV